MWKLCARDWSNSVLMGHVKIMDGDILFSHCQTLVIPVSCHGIVLGKNGLRWVRKYPEMVRKYQGLCERELLKSGLLWIYESYVLQSSKMVPLLEKLCGPLSDDKVKELKKKICFEFD